MNYEFYFKMDVMFVISTLVNLENDTYNILCKSFCPVNMAPS